MLGQMCRDLSGNSFLSSVDMPDTFHDFLRWHVLEQISASPRIQGTVNFSVSFKSGKDYHPSFREFLKNADHAIYAIPIREPKVHQRDVRLNFTKLLKGIVRGGSLADENHVRLAVDDHTDSFAEQRMVVDTQNTNSLLNIH